MSRVGLRLSRVGLRELALLAAVLLSSLAGYAPVASAAAPVASTLDVNELSTESVRLRGSVNAGGETTVYWFEYGSTTSYGAFAPAAKSGAVGSGASDVVVSQVVDGLDAGATYHFRIVAVNGSGTVEGADGVFTTRQAADDCPNATIRREQESEFLPDCRAYEQVSPVDKGGQVLGGNADSIVDLAMDPLTGRALYRGLFAVPPASAPSTSATLAFRTEAGWSRLGLFPAPGPIQIGGGLPSIDMVLRAATPDQRTIAYWDSTTEPYGSLNVRRADGTIVRIADGLALTGNAGQGSGQAFAWDFSPDGSRLYFTSNQRLGPAVGLGGSADILYEWIDDGGSGALRVVNRTNDEGLTLLSTAAAGLGGATAAASSRTNTVRGLRNAVSSGDDGHDRVFFQTPAPATDTSTTGGPIYMREDGSRTVEISAPEGANAPATQRRYLDASADGTRVFFWSGSKLTDDATDGPGIYRFDVDPDGPGDLVFLAPAGPVVANPPTALASPDGRSVLFTDGAIGTMVNIDGVTHTALAGHLPRAAAVNSGLDFMTTGPGRGIRDDRCPSASVTADGRYFVFMASTGTAAATFATNVYRYDTQDGELKALATPPSSAVGPQNVTYPLSMFVSECAGSAGYPRSYKTTVMSNDGRRVFFTSVNALTRDDTSRGLDAYEWFDDGSSTGRLSLLTKSGSGMSSFLAVDSTGDTPLIMSSDDPLAPSDGDRFPDIYAVRTNGGFAAEKVAGCAGDSCQGSVEGRPGLASAVSGDLRSAGDALRRTRAAFSLTLSGRQRARLASGRSGVLRVRVNRAGAIRVVGRANLAGKSRVVVRGGRLARRAGTVLVPLRLSQGAREALSRGSRLRVLLSARFSGAEPRRLALRLEDGK